ncbi:hypothetical protein L7F22_042586 [Adiantum nelumboides]|nr:hypothetical protein [Adiantum nelumboides]
MYEAHRKGKFGGKSALWNFFQDIARNLLRPKRGQRITESTKTTFEVVKLWGGPRLHDFLSGNLGGPYIFTTKRKGKKATPFQSGEHEYIFDAIGKILLDAKSKHGIASRIPIIIVEDKTTIKRRIRWNAKDDTLIGFCGSKGENHQCCSNDIITIGEGSQGYEKIINAFQNHEIENYACLLIVNPLHESLPRLALVVHCTCNRFDSIFIRAQWSHIERLWNSTLKDIIEPIIGHALDGDSRRRKFMAEDYMAKSDQQFIIDWCGWKLKRRLIGDDVYGLHDQDFVHYGKKLISPLDNPTRQLAIGCVWITLNHVAMVYSSFPIYEHKLRDGDIQRNVAKIGGQLKELQVDRQEIIGHPMREKVYYFCVLTKYSNVLIKK